MEQDLNFDTLVSQIELTDNALQNNARLVINRHVTAKAWLTGYLLPIWQSVIAKLVITETQDIVIGQIR